MEHTHIYCSHSYYEIGSSTIEVRHANINRELNAFAKCKGSDQPTFLSSPVIFFATCTHHLSPRGIYMYIQLSL